MVWCSYCGKDQVVDSDEGYVCCTGCGRVLDDNVFTSEPTFAKAANGASVFVGNIVKNGQYSRIVDGSGTYAGYQSNSHQRTVDKGRNEIRDIANTLSISGGDDTISAAHRIYVIALERNFTKGRRTAQVAAACLYIVCRQGNKPYLLIDFSDCLQTSVYVLGAVFLQLCNLLRLEQHPMVQKPVDPSLFIHRFTDKLFQKIRCEPSPKLQHQVANSALRIVASMKHDWMQTGRRPSGICGAALFVSARMHKVECTKADVEAVVFVCKATITKRLVEFSNTEAGNLTPEEFEAKAKEREDEMQMAGSRIDIGINGERVIKDVICEHKDMGAKHHAHGLCRNCYDEFMKISGGLQGGSAPPAFQRAEKKRKEREKRIAQSKLEYMDTTPRLAEAVAEKEENNEPESLSDIDDSEVTTYLNTEDEIKMKTIVWTEMNKEYIQEQEAKEAALKAQADSIAAVSTTGTAAEIAAASVVFAKKKAKRQKLGDPASKVPAKTAAEAARGMLKRKRLSSKLNDAVLETMFDGNDAKPTMEAWAEEPPGNDATNAKEVEEEEDEEQEEECDDEAAMEMPGSYSFLYEQPVEEEYYEEY